VRADGVTFPAELFEKVLKEILPLLSEKWHSRNSRPLPESVQFALTKFAKIWIADGSTLEALFKKLKSLEDIPQGQLAGKIGVVIDLMTRLPGLGHLLLFPDSSKLLPIPDSLFWLEASLF
jgi:hypothetical protein